MLNKFAESLRIQLTKFDSVDFKLSDLFGENYYEEIENNEIYIRREEFENKLISNGILEPFQNILEETIERSGWRKEDIQFVLPIGISLQIPIIKRKISEITVNAQILEDSRFDESTSIVRGAAIRSYQMLYEPDQESNVSLLDEMKKNFDQF